jgi:hypothetical protein
MIAFTGYVLESAGSRASRSSSQLSICLPQRTLSQYPAWGIFQGVRSPK